MFLKFYNGENSKVVGVVLVVWYGNFILGVWVFCLILLLLVSGVVKV